jgi:hypothetical protein
MAASLGISHLRVEFCMGGCEERTLAREAEEYDVFAVISRCQGTADEDTAGWKKV